VIFPFFSGRFNWGFEVAARNSGRRHCQGPIFAGGTRRRSSNRLLLRRSYRGLQRSGSKRPPICCVILIKYLIFIVIDLSVIYYPTRTIFFPNKFYLGDCHVQQLTKVSHASPCVLSARQDYGRKNTRDRKLLLNWQWIISWVITAFLNESLDSGKQEISS